MKIKRYMINLISGMTAILMVAAAAGTVHVYADYGEISVTIPIEVVSIEEGLTDAPNAPEMSVGEKYTFCLAEASEADIPNTDRVLSEIETGDGSANFETISYDRPGDYGYTVYQKEGSNRNIIYDDQIFQVHTQVKRVQGQENSRLE